MLIDLVYKESENSRKNTQKKKMKSLIKGGQPKYVVRTTTPLLENGQKIPKWEITFYFY